MDDACVTSQTIVVIDDQPLIMTSIAEQLAAGFPHHKVLTSADSSIVGTVAAGDLVCLDFRLADGSRPTLTVQDAVSRGAAVLVVTSGATAAELGECIRAGAAGVVLKNELEASLLPAARTAMTNGLVLNFATAHALGLLHLLLDPPEQRLVQLVSHGLSPEEAALHTTVGTQPIAWLSQAMWTHLRDRLRSVPANLGRVCIVDDHLMTATGIAELLKVAIPEVTVSNESTLEGLLSSPLPFDLILLDVLLDDSSPSANVRDAVATGAAVVLVTSVQPTSAAEVDLVAGAFAAGARALLLKTDPPTEVLEAIAEVMSGHTHINRSWAEVMRFQTDQLGRLTPAERKVFTLRREGLSRAEIASTLVCSEDTVKGHCRDIAQRLTADWTQRIRP